MADFEKENEIRLRITCTNADSSLAVFEQVKVAEKPPELSIKHSGDSAFDFEANWFELFLIATSSRLAAQLVFAFLQRFWTTSENEKKVDKVEIVVNNTVFVVNDPSELNEELTKKIDDAITDDGGNHGEN